MEKRSVKVVVKEKEDDGGRFVNESVMYKWVEE